MQYRVPGAPRVPILEVRVAFPGFTHLCSKSGSPKLPRRIYPRALPRVPRVPGYPGYPATLRIHHNVKLSASSALYNCKTTTKNTKTSSSKSGD
eukprot:3351204-Rhodomonas_salina.1